MKSTLLVHIPKTGGTTLDDILGEEFDPDLALRRVQHDSGIDQWERLQDPRFQYVSGHFSSGAIDFARFEHRITVLRPPLEQIASTLRYSETYFPDSESVRLTRLGAWRHDIFGLYFAPGFDLLRYIAERQYGVAVWLHDYADPCTLNGALETLERFNRVLNFHQLESEIKRLIMELGLTPRADLPRHRSYRYEPDLERAQALLTDFDTSFYKRAQKRFRKLPADIDLAYERYREGFCAARGLRIEPLASAELPLFQPIGQGWHPAERLENGRVFRWASRVDPGLDLAIAQPGTYVVTAYVHPHQCTGLGLRAAGEFSGAKAAVEVSERQGVTVLRARVVLPRADWLRLSFSSEKAGAETGAADLLGRTFVLGRVLVRREAQ
ncbi:MAG: hypothetical protein JNM33_09275 [Rubrivivax sp.]|nr:hypothetical protein [Rubrivivax sp.]